MTRRDINRLRANLARLKRAVESGTADQATIAAYMRFRESWDDLLRSFGVSSASMAKLESAMTAKDGIPLTA